MLPKKSKVNMAVETPFVFLCLKQNIICGNDFTANNKLPTTPTKYGSILDIVFYILEL